MSDWTAGYVADIGYTYGYYTELNPLRVKLAFLNAGLALPPEGSACELGFGQGVSINVHASASMTQWHGTDFNPSQAAFAQELANKSGSGAQLHDDAFADFCSRGDLPDFDYIALHGIWSWISDENRSTIVDFVRRKLKVGGVLYISYNTLPGWSAFAPMRHLMTQHAESMGATGAGIVQRIDGALDFAQRMLDTNPTYARANPLVPGRLKQVASHNREYLAHEYFNADWHPMYFADMASWLTSAKLTYACSAVPLELISAINFTPDQQALLADIPDTQLRESVKDFLINQQFRKDYWVKGPRKLSGVEQGRQIRALRIVLTSYRGAVQLKVKGGIGEANLNEAVYTPLLDILTDHKIRTMAQMEAAIAPKGINFAQLVEAMVILSGMGVVQLAQDDFLIVKAKKSTDKLNAYLIEQSQGRGEINYLASPVTGGGVSVPRFSQLFLLGRSQGMKHPSEWAQFAWNILAAQGQRIIKDGHAIEDPADNLAELNAQAEVFGKEELPILKALQVA